jgi:hypothetical protein
LGNVDLTVEVNRFALTVDVYGTYQDGHPETFEKASISQSQITASKTRSSSYNFVLNRFSGEVTMTADHPDILGTRGWSSVHTWTGPSQLMADRKF